MSFFKKKRIDKENLVIPTHIAIIMDGNGRWAKKRSLPRTAGHAAGSKKFKEIARYCNKIGVKHLTVYAFSTENWKRPKEEVDTIMDIFRDYLTELDKLKPVIVCGDLNVAHQEIDLKNPKSNIGNPGFSYEERGKFTQLLDSGFTDSFRWLYPDKTDAYSWWSYRAAARERNVGWRIDYFVISDRLREKVKDAYIFPEVMGSDHCPVGIDITW